jgi:hypothetical protein
LPYELGPQEQLSLICLPLLQKSPGFHPVANQENYISGIIRQIFFIKTSFISGFPDSPDYSSNTSYNQVFCFV